MSEVYDNFRLWCLPPPLIQGIRFLPLARILGNQANAEECIRLLNVIDETDFNSLPSSWRHRTRRNDGKELSPGRRGNGADWLYYDPWQRQPISRETALARAHTQLYMPVNHPVKLDFTTPIPAYTWDDVTAAVGANNANGNVTDDSEDDGADDGQWGNAVNDWAARQQQQRQQ